MYLGQESPNSDLICYTGSVLQQTVLWSQVVNTDDLCLSGWLAYESKPQDSHFIRPSSTLRKSLFPCSSLVLRHLRTSFVLDTPSLHSSLSLINHRRPRLLPFCPLVAGNITFLCFLPSFLCFLFPSFLSPLWTKSSSSVFLVQDSRQRTDEGRES